MVIYATFHLNYSVTRRENDETRLLSFSLRLHLLIWGSWRLRCPSLEFCLCTDWRGFALAAKVIEDTGRYWGNSQNGERNLEQFQQVLLTGARMREKTQSLHLWTPAWPPGKRWCPGGVDPCPPWRGSVACCPGTPWAPRWCSWDRTRRNPKRTRPPDTIRGSVMHLSQSITAHREKVEILRRKHKTSQHLKKVPISLPRVNQPWKQTAHKLTEMQILPTRSGGGHRPFFLGRARLYSARCWSPSFARKGGWSSGRCSSFRRGRACRAAGGSSTTTTSPGSPQAGSWGPTSTSPFSYVVPVWRITCCTWRGVLPSPTQRYRGSLQARYLKYQDWSTSTRLMFNYIYIYMEVVHNSVPSLSLSVILCRWQICK